MSLRRSEATEAISDLLGKTEIAALPSVARNDESGLAFMLDCRIRTKPVEFYEVLMSENRIKFGCLQEMNDTCLQMRTGRRRPFRSVTAPSDPRRGT
jgi:hypothetical protein